MFNLGKDTTNHQVVYGAVADGKAVNRLLVSYVDAASATTCESVSRVTFSNEHGSAAAVKVSVSAKMPRLSPTDQIKDCTPNASSATVSEVTAGVELLASGASEAFQLGHNCNWLFEFESANDDCPVTLRLVDSTGHLVRILTPSPIANQPAPGAPHGGNVYVLKARAGESTELRLSGETNWLRFTTGGNPDYRTHYSISGLEFTSCPPPDGTTAIEFVKADGSAPGEDVTYTLTPLVVGDASAKQLPRSCVGDQPDPQTEKDVIVVGTGDDTKRVHHLSFFCDWEVSFFTANSCKVELRLFIRERPETHPFFNIPTTFKLRGDVPTITDSTESTSKPGSIDDEDTIRYPGAGGSIDTFLAYDGPYRSKSTIQGQNNIEFDGTSDYTDRVYKIEHKSVTGTDNAECATDITLKNKSKAGSNTSVTVTQAPPAADAMAVPPVEACTAHDRGRGAAKTLVPQEEAMLRLALKCNWVVTFSADNPNCAASVELKDADDTTIGTAKVDDLRMDGGGSVTLNKSAAGLTFTPTGGTATVIKTLEFDGCVVATNAATTPPNSAKVTVIDTTPGYDFNYALEKSSCAAEADGSGDGKPKSPTGPADAVVSVDSSTDNVEYVHYLDYRCDWELTSATHGHWCSASYDVENSTAAEADRVLATDQGNQVLTKHTAMQQFQLGAVGVGTNDEKKIDTLRAAVNFDQANCTLSLDFVNVSRTRAVEVQEPPKINTPGNFEDQLEPKTLLRLTPKTAVAPGATACPAASIPAMATDDPVELAAMAVKVESGEPVRVQGEVQFTAAPETQSLDKTCDWLVEFAPEDDWCLASAQVRDLDGEPVGNAVAGVAFYGGSLTLTADADGLMYAPGGVTAKAKVVGSIEFVACVTEAEPAVAPVYVLDHVGDTDVTYTLSRAEVERPLTEDEVAAGTPQVAYRTTCDGFGPVPPGKTQDDVLPQAKTAADALVYTESASVTTQLLDYRCDWDVKFAGTPACASVFAWGPAAGAGSSDEAEQVVFLGSAAPATGLRLTQAGPHVVSAAQYQAALAAYNAAVAAQQAVPNYPGYPVDDQGVPLVHPSELYLEDPSQNTQLGARAGFVYFVGSEGGVRDTQLKSTGLVGVVDLTGPQRVTAVSLECVSALDFTSVSGLENPGLEITAAPAPRTPEQIAGEQTAGCLVYSPLSPSVASQETLSVELVRGCDWNITFKSSASACRAAVKVQNAAGDTLELVRQSSSAAASVTLTSHADGLQFTPSVAGATASAVAGLEFYDCFYPSVSVQVPGASVGDEFTVRFTAVGAKAGCTAAATQTVELGPNLTPSDDQRTAPQEHVTNLVSGSPALLVNLAADGTACEYAVLATSSNLGLAAFRADARVSAQTSHTVLRRVAGLTLRNATEAGALTEVQRSVVVTLTPKTDSCSSPLPQSSSATLGLPGTATASQVVTLAERCVWTVTYASADTDCVTEAVLNDVSGSPVSGTTTDSDGTLELTTRMRTAGSTPVAEVEFTVTTAGCAEPSTTPTVALAAASDTAPADGRFTQTRTPTFEVTGVVAGGEVTVTASKGVAPNQTTVSRMLARSAVTGTSANVIFTAATDCTRNGTAGQSCSLEDGDWEVIATHNQGAQYQDADSMPIMVTVVNAAPAVTLTADPADLRAVSSRSTATSTTLTLTVTSEVPSVVAGLDLLAALNASSASLVTMTGTGTLGTWSGSGATYTATYIADALGADTSKTASFAIAAGAFGDAAGNQNTALAAPLELTTQLQQLAITLTNATDSNLASVSRYGVTVTLSATAQANASCSSGEPHNTPYVLVAGQSVKVSVLPYGENCQYDVGLALTDPTAASLCDITAQFVNEFDNDRGPEQTDSVAGIIRSFSGLGEVDYAHPGQTAENVAGLKLEVTCQSVAAEVQLRNVTVANQHTPATRGGVVVTVEPVVSSCDSVPSNASTQVLAAATGLATLGENACEWAIKFTNADSQCLVDARLMKNVGGTPSAIRTATADTSATVTAGSFENPPGSLSVWVGDNQEILSAASGGETVSHIEFTVKPQADCTSYIANPQISLTITDTMPTTHTGRSIAVTVAPDAASDGSARADCTASTPVMVPLGGQSTSRAGAVFMPATAPQLVAVPVNPNPAVTVEACEYTATFATPVTIGTGQAALTFERVAGAAATAPLTATTTAAASSYDVVRDAAFSVDNITTGAHTSEGLTTRRNVTVTVAKSGTCATDNPDAVSDLTPAATPATINLKQANCNWDVSYRNTNTDCKVVVTLKEPGASAGTAGAAITGFADTSDGEFSLKTAGRRVVVSVPDGSGGTTDKVVGSAEFNVPDPLDSGSGGQCTTFFAGTASVTITDTQTPPGDHGETTFMVTVAKQSGADDKCVTIDGMPAGVTLTVPTGQATASLVLAAVPLAKKLVDLPYYPDKTVARCKYDVTFPADTNSVGVAGVTLKAPVDRTVELSNANSDSRAASLTYDARRPARFDLVNITGTSVAAHKVAGMEQVMVSVAPTADITCADAAPSGSPFTVEAGANNSPAVAAATVNVALGEADCSWTISYNNPNSDCEVTAMLKDDTDTDIPSDEFTYPAAAAEGSLTLHTVGRRLRIGSAADAKLVSAVELEVTGTCDTFFDGAVTLTITDTAPAALSGSLTLRLTPPAGRATECTEATDVTVPLNKTASRAGVEFPATAAQLANLIDVPLGSSGGSCIYTVAFRYSGDDWHGPGRLHLGAHQRCRHGYAAGAHPVSPRPAGHLAGCGDGQL